MIMKCTQANACKVQHDDRREIIMKSMQAYASKVQHDGRWEIIIKRTQAYDLRSNMMGDNH
jgi:hypothetical protein